MECLMDGEFQYPSDDISDTGEIPIANEVDWKTHGNATLTLCYLYVSM